jgi:hypothetical protein
MASKCINFKFKFFYNKSQQTLPKSLCIFYLHCLFKKINAILYKFQCVYINKLIFLISIKTKKNEIQL